MACNESTRVNVGDPIRPQRDRVLGNKTKKNKNFKKPDWKSDVSYYSELGRAKHMGKDTG
jgi:hypothetical protein